MQTAHWEVGRFLLRFLGSCIAAYLWAIFCRLFFGKNRSFFQVRYFHTLSIRHLYSIYTVSIRHLYNDTAVS